MKNIMLMLFLFSAMSSVIMFQDFETDRLPIGDLESKYDFCAVKLDKLFDTNLNKETSFIIESVDEEKK